MWLPTSAQTPSSTHCPRGRKRHPVGFAEVTRDNRSVDRRDDLGQRDALSRSRQYVAAADTTLGAYETDALQTEEDLFEVRLG